MKLQRSPIATSSQSIDVFHLELNAHRESGEMAAIFKTPDEGSDTADEGELECSRPSNI
jgi:hypothetical protein